ncbi:hypothetical protein ACFOSV_05355 [Algoriphagus namhaensis]|uniref:Uncharacterized protein n=1 Tax=Algoriphagus namhaensis TaxID=915353 RepID=A0ABV8ANR4_9BACT
MNKANRNSHLIRQRLSVALAMLFCLFFSNLEYVSETVNIPSIEQQEENSDEREQSFISVAVDAVVPFAVQVVQAVFQLIYQALDLENQGFALESPSIGFTSSLGEVFFERIISPQGP